MSIQELTYKYDYLNKIFITKVSERDQLLNKRRSIEKDMASIDIETLEKANILLNKLSESQRSRACKELQDLCTKALQYAVSPNYEMEIELYKSRNKPAADIYIRKKDVGTRTSPLTSNGGGIVDIIGTALRLVVIEIYQPFIDGPIMMDEPYKMVSEEYIPFISDFIIKMSKDFDRQIILCTHNTYLKNSKGNCIHVNMGEDNKSQVIIGPSVGSFEEFLSAEGVI